MLELTIEGGESFDERTSEFITHDPTTIRLEHSLVSISKWESIWEIPFLTKDSKTGDQLLSYIKCMDRENSPDEVYYRLNNYHFAQINDFINSKKSATWFSEQGPKKIAGRSTEVVTSELIYYWMIAFNIPFEAQNWHLYRLMNLIRICSVKNQDPKKNRMNKRDAMARQRELNAMRRAQLGTTG